MTHHLLGVLREFIVNYGYWAVAIVLLLENTGVPVPGETVLLVASFMAYSERNLSLIWLIVVATLAAALGDNLGYWIGRRGGRPLLDRYAHIFRISPRIITRGESLFGRYGAPTVLFARFVFGLRVIAGPLAGVLQMPWKSFAVCNFVGAAVWTSVICGAGYLFGQHWEALLGALRRLDMAVVAILVVIVAGLWWRRSRARADPDPNSDPDPRP